MVVTQREVKVFPNPSSGMFNLEFQEESNISRDVKVYDIMGRTVFSLTKTALQKITLDLSSNVNGMYFIGITTNSTTTYYKIIKE
jgi:hypothetical protein